MRRTAFADQFLQDVRYGLRALRRSPAFTSIAVLTLGLSTGAFSTVFTLANTFFFRDLPVTRPEQVVAVQATRRHGQVDGSVSYPDYIRFRDHNKTLQGLAAHYSTAPLFVTAGNNAKEINGAVVTSNFFPLLGITPAAGRFFRPDEDAVPDRDRVAVLGYGLWRNWFGSSLEALGSTVKINGVPFTVIGVAPGTFRGVTPSPGEIYIPTMMLRVGYRWCDDSLARDCTMLDMIGRLAEGRTAGESKAEMATLAPPDWETAPEGENSGVTVFHPKGASRSDETVRFISLLAGVATVLLFVCCANLAGLLIARGAARSHELAIRASLGAGRMRLIRQLMTESLLLALIGGGIGVWLSLLMTSALNTMFYSLDSEGHTNYYDFSPQPLVIVAVAALSIVTVILYGVIPALRSVRYGTAESLKRQSSAISGSSRLGRWLVGAQTAIAVALVSIAVLLIASARTLVNGTQYEASHVALMRLRPQLLKYSPGKAQRFQRDVVRRLEALDGVRSVSMVGMGVVLFGGGAEVSLPEWTGSSSRSVQTSYNEVGPRYFETLGTPVLRGREFDAHDSADAPAVAIVNESLARRLWPGGGNGIGSTIVVRQRPHTVVGLVKDVPLNNRTENSKSFVFLPYWQNPKQVDARFCVRVAGDPAVVLPMLVREVNRLDPDVPIAETITLPVQMAGMFRPVRISATFVAYAAGLAALLSAIGIYGTLAFSVSRRTKEIGIRMAVGAEARGVLAMIVREGMTVILRGATAGLGLAVAGTSVVRHLLYGSARLDALFYAAAASLIVCMGLLACSIPARRAASLDPITALRDE